MAKGIEYENVAPKKQKPYKNKINYKEVNYYTFGKFVLNRKRLNDENILLVKYPKSNAPVPKIRRTKITDDFKNLINDMLDTQQINIQLQKELSDEEQDLLDLLLGLAGIKDKLGFRKVSKDINDYMKRFEVLRGAIVAGNDSPDIRTELIEIIDLLSNKTIGKITPLDAIMLKECLE